MNVAVLDIGKTNVKFAVFDALGKLLFERQTKNIVLNRPPYPHFDVERTWNFLGESLREAVAQFEIGALVPTTHGASGAVMNEAGLVLPIMDYEFAGVDIISERYNKLRDPFKKTFSPSLTVGLNWGRQLAYAAWHHEVEFANATHIVTYPQYWTWRLTGIFANDICSLGTHTDLWLPLENKPSHLADQLGVSAKLAKVVAPWTEIGLISKQVANEFGIAPTIRILSGIHDSNASLLPFLGAWKKPFTLLSTGTWVITMAIGHALDSLDPALDMLANIDAEGRPIACANFMGGREYGAIAQDCSVPPSLGAVEALINTNVFAVPSFSPGSGPYAARRGEIIGPLKPEQRASLATLYCALMCVKRLEDLNVTEGDIIVDGNFAQNAVLCSMIATLKPAQNIYAARDHSGTARGAAILAHWHETREPVQTTHIKAANLSGLLSYYEKWKAMIG